MRKILFVFIALAGILFTACQHEEGLVTNDDGGSTYVEDGFILNLTIPGTRANAYTTIEPVRTESDIYSLHLAFFERTADGSGAYKGFYSVDIDPDSPLDIINPVNVRFDESSGLSNKESYNILIVANLDWFLKGMTLEDWIDTLPALTEKQVKDQTRAWVEGEPDETVYSDGLDRLPMSASVYKEALSTNVSVILNRTVARIDVISYIGATYDLVSASIWNGFPYSSIWEGEVDYSDDRIQRYYGLLTEPRTNGQYDLINGGLYAFENYVQTPETNDRLTTCVIIGMRNLDASAPDYNVTLYYRINIHSYESAQKLERNSSYNITLRGVLDRGYKTELEAYLGESDRLDIVINYWDLDDDGLIMYDGDNILAVPMKRINIPATGDEREYSVFTLGQGNLAITKNTVPTGIDVRLDGNMLYVNSEPLTSTETSRTGEVELTFGNLKATVYINQSGEITNGEFIELTPAELSVFPAYGISTSETVVVRASGAWTAKLFNEGFSFDPHSAITEIRSTQGDSFTISTTGSNPQNSSRLGFVVVSLDDQPDINRSIVVTQRGQGALNVLPNTNQVYFNAYGNVMTGSVNTFRVDPGDDGKGVVNRWNVSLQDETHFYISEYVYDPVNIANNTFTVSTRKDNTSPSALSTGLKVYIEDEPSIDHNITVIQGTFTISVSPNEFGIVPPAGATLGPVTVTSPSGYNWTATISTTTDAKGHSAMLLDAYGNQTQTVKGTNRDAFRIEFPKLTIPNIKPEATVTVTVDGTTLPAVTFKITQTSLVPRKLRFNSKGTSHGSLMPGYAGYNYINILGDNLYNQKYFGPSGVVPTDGSIERTKGYSKPINAAITNFHANQGCHAYREAIVAWLKSDHRNFLSVCVDKDRADQEKLLRLLSSSFTVSSTNVKKDVKRSLSNTSASHRQSKVWEYLTKTGPFTNNVSIDVDKTAFYSYSSDNNSLTSWPSTTIPVIMHPTNPNACILAVDPVLKAVIMGDAEMFSSKTKLNVFTEGSDNWKFLNNLIAFMVNAGMYGDDFLDEFR